VALAHIKEIKRLTKGEAEIALDDGALLRASRTYRDVVDRLIAN